MTSLDLITAQPKSAHRTEVAGTICVNCGETILRRRIAVRSQLRPGDTIHGHFGPWEHLQGKGDGATRYERQLCSSVPADVEVSA
jgi:hypothetical protein